MSTSSGTPLGPWPRGQTALATAAFRGSLPIVRTLLEDGSDPALGSPSALEVARFFDHCEVVAVLTGG